MRAKLWSVKPLGWSMGDFTYVVFHGLIAGLLIGSVFEWTTGILAGVGFPVVVFGGVWLARRI